MSSADHVQDYCWFVTSHNLVWFNHDEESVVYHSGSGDAIRLNALDSDILSGLASHPGSSAEQIIQAVSLRNSLEPLEIREYVAASLAQLYEVGLVRRFSSEGVA